MKELTEAIPGTDYSIGAMLKLKLAIPGALVHLRTVVHGRVSTRLMRSVMLSIMSGWSIPESDGLCCQHWQC